MCKCLAGYADGFVSGNPLTYDCVPCYVKCATCSTTPTSCLTCLAGTSRAPALSCGCPAIGYYDAFVLGNSSTYICVPCASAACQQCSLVNDSVCDICYGTNRLATTCDCPAGNYSIFVAGNTSTYDCVPCQSPCVTCTSDISCLSCVGVQNSSITRITPLCNCPNGTYSNLTLSQDCIRNRSLP